MPEYQFPPLAKRKVMGKGYARIEGPEKASGRAKYTSDYNKPNQLWGAVLTCPLAHCRVKSIDTGAAEKMKGVTAVRVTAGAGTEIQWAGWEVAFVAADSEQIARDAVRAIQVDYEPMPFVVNEDDLKKVGSRAKAAGEQIEGDPDQTLKSAEVVSEGEYGIPTITHCCLEPHGQVVAWSGDKVEYNPSTQSLTPIQGDLARQLNVPAANVHVHQDNIGGGFGSKFQSDRWGVESAHMSKASSGRPVKLYLDRATELVIAGCRPSAFAKIKVGGQKDGTITAWESVSWASGGVGGGGMPPIPYVLTKIPNRRLNHTAVSLNTAPIRAWRAPNHQQASFLTCNAIEDFAAKIGMDPLEVMLKNTGLTPRPEVYERQLKKAAEIAEWKKLWHPRGQGAKSGSMVRGLGIGLCTWGGRGHGCTARCTIQPDGSVAVEMSTQDLGTGTRTAMAMVAAEILGLKVPDIAINIGDSNYPPGGTSGGSTTIGGVSAATLKAAINAREKLFEAVAPALGAQPADLEAADGKIMVKGNPAKALAWKAACQKLGVKTVSETGVNNPQTSVKEGLNNEGVGGVQIADVSVDLETGVVKMNRMVAVQDCGNIVNPKLAESQINGAVIMSICGALMEERVVDDATGRVLNADMEFYKLAGIKDVGEIVVHLDIDETNDKRGVIGLGEPPATGGIAAISNAVANAIGVRVKRIPLSPDRVLGALMERKES